MKMPARHIRQWVLLTLVFIVIIGGWFFPILGWLVPIVMILGIIIGLFFGRFFCGHLCPRGAFYDRLIPYISPKLPIPDRLRSMAFRWFMIVLLSGLMITQLIMHADDMANWGRIFWFMCTGTTLVGLVLAVFYHPRTWCSFCPIGTIGRLVSGSQKQIHLNVSVCIGCRKCERVCPMKLTLIDEPKREVIINPDCLRCGECVRACPRRALSL